MKKIFIALAAVLLGITACTEQKSEKIRVYGWQGEGADATETSIKADFEKWKSHGLDGICYNVGFNLEKQQRAAKLAHEC